MAPKWFVRTYPPEGIYHESGGYPTPADAMLHAEHENGGPMRWHENGSRTGRASWTADGDSRNGRFHYYIAQQEES